MEGTCSPRSNRLLSRLPPELYHDIHRQLRFCRVLSGKAIFEADRRVDSIYFPVSGVIARIATSPHDEWNQFSFCGKEGAVGISPLVGGASLATCLVLVDALLYHCSHDVFSRYLHNSEFRAAILRYARFVLDEAVQTALCNRHHSLEQQLCRWLLTCLDRASAIELRVTHEVMGRMLGVRREGITETVGKLQACAAVRTGRGYIRIVCREALLERACECYQLLEHRYRQLMRTEDSEPKAANSQPLPSLLRGAKAARW